MSTTLSTSRVLDNAVADFQAKFAANPALLTRGQFQIQMAPVQAVVQVVEAEFASVGSVDSDVRAAFEAYKRSFTTPKTAAKVLETIKRKKLERNLPQTFRVFSPDGSATKAWANGLFQAIWNNHAITGPPPVTAPTAQKVLAAREREASACFTTTGSMGRKFLHAKSSTLKASKGNYASALIADARLKNESGGKQTVVYDPKKLGDAVGKIMSALSAGYLYLVGSLSGQNHTNVGRTFPSPEHYLLLFAHDGADRFAFWDSDLETSDIGLFPSWGTGFGILAHRDGHFSTALDQDDFDKTDSGGNHLNFPVRHRYQVYTAAPIP